MSLSSARNRRDHPGDGRQWEEETEADRRIIGHDVDEVQVEAAASRSTSRSSEESSGPTGPFGGLRRLVSSKKFVSDNNNNNNNNNNDNDDDGDEEATQKTSGYLSTPASEVSEFWGSLFDNHRGDRSENDDGKQRPSSSSRSSHQRKQSKKSLEKRGGRSDCSDILEVDEEGIDFVVSLKVLLAEAKSDADAASVQNASLVKETVRLEHCLEATTSRSEFCAHLKSWKLNSSTKGTSPQQRQGLPVDLRRAIKRQLTAARKEINTRRTATTVRTCVCTKDKAKASSDVGTNLELSVMRRRVEDLEKQNRMLRSELVGAGHELDEHRYQHQQSLSTLDAAAAADIGYPDEVSSSMHRNTLHAALLLMPDALLLCFILYKN